MIKIALLVLVLSRAVSCDAAEQSAPAGQKAARVELRWLGTAGWEIGDGATVILVDPYISRLFGPQPPGRAPFAQTSGDTRPVYGWDDIAKPDTAAIDARISQAHFILVTHAHYDHDLDVPYIALKHHATVIGTESTVNIMRAYDVPEDQLVTVRGGEDYDFGAFSVRVIPSLHSPLDHKHYFSADVAPKGLKAPLTLRQLHPEGGTLAYLIRFHNHQILAFGGMNYIEREITGLQPEVVLVGAAASRNELYDYAGRLLRALQYPPLVIPTHWDNFTAPYEASQQTAIDALESFKREVSVASPHSRVIVPKYFEPIPLN